MKQRSALIWSIGVSIAVPAFAAVLVRERTSPRAVDAPAREQVIREEPAFTAVQSPERVELPPQANERQLAPSLQREFEAAPLRSLESALREGRAGPADWSAQLAACADEWGGADRAVLAQRAVDSELDVVQRLAALELLRALRAGEAVEVARESLEFSPEPVELSSEQSRELIDLALGSEQACTASWAAAGALAAFGDQRSRGELLDQLAQGDDSVRSRVALHGLRECARGVVLDETAARLALTPEPLAQERLAAAAQGMALALGAREETRAQASTQADELLALARKDGISPATRRRLLLSVAALGSARTQTELCDIACDASADGTLALESAHALRASPRRDVALFLEPRLSASNLDDARRQQLSAICDALRHRDARVTP